MSFFVEVLCTESIDSAACIIVGTDSYRFIFNCGEGVQRLCVEHKVRLGKIAAVLVTDFKPQNCFGLPGKLIARGETNANFILATFWLL